MSERQSHSHLAPGAVIGGKYRVERVLGRGGMGIVLAARHLELDQDVAIKLLLPAASENADAAARFLREGKAAARFATPHVAKVYDTGKLPSGELYLVMEFLRGRDLKQVVAENGPQPLEIVVRWALEAIEALAEAHSLGIVHRDIKPANIFLASTPTGRQLIKIVDFGISKQIDSGNAELTATSMAMGSPLYMAPEQMESAKRVDARVDIWALGTVLYELTTGRTPFQAENLLQVLSSVLQATPEPPSAHNRELPAAFDRVVLRCLEKSPAARYGSVLELGAALRDVVAARTSEAPPADSQAAIKTGALPRGLRPAVSTVPLDLPVVAATSELGPAATQGGSTGRTWDVRVSSPRRPASRIRFALLAATALSVAGAAGYLAYTRLATQPQNSTARFTETASAPPMATTSVVEPPPSPPLANGASEGGSSPPGSASGITPPSPSASSAVATAPMATTTGRAVLPSVGASPVAVSPQPSPTIPQPPLATTITSPPIKTSKPTMY